MEDNIFEFKNLETGKNIKLCFDKQFIVVYGKNGCGKTTLSRSENFNKKFVFNSDFINKNVYVIDSNGAKDDPKTKEGFSSLWINENIINLKKELDTLKDNQKNVQSAKNDISLKINKKFNDFGFAINLQNYDSELDKYSESVPKDNKWEEQVKKYKSPLAVTTTIKNDQELKASINNYNNNLAKESFINQLNNSVFLTDLFINKTEKEILTLKGLNDQYNKDIEDIHMYEKSFKTKDVDTEKDWIRTGLELHKDINQCLFCKNEDIHKTKEEWTKLINSKANQSKDKLLHFIKKCIEDTKPIYENKDLIKKIFPKTIEALIKIYLKFQEYLKEIKESKEINIDESFI